MTSVSSSYNTPRPSAPEGLLIEQSVDCIASQLGGNPEAYMAAIVMKFANERSDAAREQRQQTEEHIAKVQGQQIERLRDAADELRDGALWGAAGGVVGGAVTMYSGTLNLQKENQLATKLAGLGTMVQGAGDGVEGVCNANSQHDEASATAADNRADAATRRLEIVQDDLDGARELEKAALDFLDQVVEIRAQTDQSMFIRG
jgi:hypothetical protein